MADNFQTLEQAARDIIDAMLERAGWKVQSKNEIDFNAGRGIAVREYPTDVGPADYVLLSTRNQLAWLRPNLQSRVTKSQQSRSSPGVSQCQPQVGRQQRAPPLRLRIYR